MIHQAVLLVLLLAAYTHGSCYRGLADLDPETGRGKCEVSEGVTLLDGESRVVEEICFHCSCEMDGYSCCGVGINSGYIGAQEGFKMVKDPPCDFHFEPVREDE